MSPEHPPQGLMSGFRLPPGFRPNWWMLGLAGLAALLPALLLRPAPSPPPVATEHVAPGPDETVLEEAAPREVSLVDVGTKAALGLLLIAAAGWGLVKLSQRRGGRRVAADDWPEAAPRLRLAESLPLGPQQGTLHLVEVDGTTVLLSAVLDQVSLLLTLAPDHTSSFAPVPPVEPACAPAPPVETHQWLSPTPPATDEKPAPVPDRPALLREREADWSRERSRLIHALRAQASAAPQEPTHL
ncbi:MAG: flagellar biosynthetic protein FliO [Armatimonadetes bacterium]|nr:flagellar biosynthetic protein FliO [Armatimonadota bacterium]